MSELHWGLESLEGQFDLPATSIEFENLMYGEIGLVECGKDADILSRFDGLGPHLLLLCHLEGMLRFARSAATALFRMAHSRAS